MITSSWILTTWDKAGVQLWQYMFADVTELEAQKSAEAEVDQDSRVDDWTLAEGYLHYFDIDEIVNLRTGNQALAWVLADKAADQAPEQIRRTDWTNEDIYIRNDLIVVSIFAGKNIEEESEEEIF